MPALRAHLGVGDPQPAAAAIDDPGGGVVGDLAVASGHPVVGDELERALAPVADDRRVAQRQAPGDHPHPGARAARRIERQPAPVIRRPSSFTGAYRSSTRSVPQRVDRRPPAAGRDQLERLGDVEVAGRRPSSSPAPAGCSACTRSGRRTTMSARRWSRSPRGSPRAACSRSGVQPSGGVSEPGRDPVLGGRGSARRTRLRAIARQTSRRLGISPIQHPRQARLRSRRYADSWASSSSPRPSARRRTAWVTRVGPQALLDRVLGDHALGDVAPRGQLELHVHQRLLEDRAQSAGAGLALERLVGDRARASRPGS